MIRGVSWRCCWPKTNDVGFVRLLFPEPYLLLDGLRSITNSKTSTCRHLKPLDSWRRISLSNLDYEKEEAAMSTVLVTGGSGFIGSHCIIQLLAAGHQVRTTVRSLNREGDTRAMLKEGGAEPGDRLSFVTADLEKDAGWPEAVAGCEYVLHVASPLPQTVPKDENELIVPAREGTLRVLRAARDAGVKRVVLTSSFASIGYGHQPQSKPFDETSWTNLDGSDVLPYVKSKTLAERAAWDFIKSDGGSLELSVVNPVGVFGPVLGPDYSTSILLIQRLMDGAMPGCPRLNFGVVDVRDVADMHIRAMTNPAAKGERFLAVSGDFMWILDMALALKSRLGSAAKRIPTRQIPNWVVHLFALADPAAKQIVPELGKAKNGTNEKARRVLGWAPRSREDAIVATAESLLRLGLLKESRKQAA
jgi:nucleoside-diphosphate-sugar epimerase